MEYQIRAATQADIPHIAAVIQRTWQTAYRGMIADSYLDNLSPLQWENGLSSRHEDPEGAVLTIDGTIVGAALYGGARDAEASAACGEIVAVYLLQDYWGKGLGTALLSHAIDQLQAKGYTSCILWVLRDNLRAQKAYKRMGFAPDGAESTIEIAGDALVELRYKRAL